MGPTTPEPTADVARGPWSALAGAVRVLRANPLTFVGFVLVVLLGSLALVVVVDPRLLIPYGPGQETGAYSAPPTLFHWPPSFAHPFGTDAASLDLYSGVLRALPLDLGISLFIAGAALIIGGTLGLVAGFWDTPGTVGGVLSALVLRTTDVFLALPSLLLGIAIVAALGPGLNQVVLAVLVTWWPYYVRLVRGEVLAVKHLPYVAAARAAGESGPRILFGHVLRNVLEPIVVYFTLDIATILVTFSTISFVLHAGVLYPQVYEWGSMLSFFQENSTFTSAWWEITFPALAIFVTALAFSLLGDGLRDLLDPRSRRSLAEAGRPTALPAADARTAAAPGASA